MKRTPTTVGRRGSVGQVLVLFVLFLLVLLGVSALGIDYATWLLTDRNLQNVSDHASLAGASEFDQRQTQGSCGATPAKCLTARAQAWKSLSNDLKLNLSNNSIAALAANDSPAGGQASGNYGGDDVTFTDKIWVTTPPPNYAAYLDAGGRYTLNYGVVFVRVDRTVRSFLGGAIGIQPQPRTGWATAGALPTDFALQVFCRNNVAPENGVCVNSAGLTIDGQGGIRLLRGDIGSNESLTVSSNVGRGVIVESGNMFLVNRTCAPSTWNCPQIPATTGGISDDDPIANPATANNKNAFYIAPLPVPHYESPLDEAPNSSCADASASSNDLCVPFKDQADPTPSGPGDWTCVTSGAGTLCGDPNVGTGTVTCDARVGGPPDPHLRPIADENGINGNPIDSTGDRYQNIDDTSSDLVPTDYVFSDNLNQNNGSQSYTVTLRPPYGTPQSGLTTIRYTILKTLKSGSTVSIDGGGNQVRVQVSLLQSGATVTADAWHDATATPSNYSFTTSGITDYTALSLKFTFNTPSGSSADKRGGAVSYAEAETPPVDPALPPMIPPGYYRSIVIPADGCAILDPTAVYSDLEAYQMPGIYRFGGSGSPNSRKIELGDGSFLIGDGVTLVFDADWPDSGSNQGVAIGAGGALVLNTMRVAGSVAPCAPSETETLDVNYSVPLAPLPYSSLCAAWGVDSTDTASIRSGANAWPYCDPANLSNPQCVDRSEYNPPANPYRGVTFYFSPAAWPPSGITNRFEMQGGSGNDAGLAFRGVMYAPYDDVKITGGNGFNTVGQVQAWTAKFNGGNAYIDLDYPYDYTPAAPYLLEPTVDH
jgi:hypothetical protein